MKVCIICGQMREVLYVHGRPRCKECVRVPYNNPVPTGTVKIYEKIRGENNMTTVQELMEEVSKLRERVEEAERPESKGIITEIIGQKSTAIILHEESLSEGQAKEAIKKIPDGVRKGDVFVYNGKKTEAASSFFPLFPAQHY